MTIQGVQSRQHRPRRANPTVPQNPPDRNLWELIPPGPADAEKAAGSHCRRSAPALEEGGESLGGPFGSLLGLNPCPASAPPALPEETRESELGFESHIGKTPKIILIILALAIHSSVSLPGAALTSGSPAGRRRPARPGACP